MAVNFFLLQGGDVVGVFHGGVPADTATLYGGYTIDKKGVYRHTSTGVVLTQRSPYIVYAESSWDEEAQAYVKIPGNGIDHEYWERVRWLRIKTSTTYTEGKRRPDGRVPTGKRVVPGA